MTWYCYVATADCGCVAAVHVDETDHKPETAKFLSDMVKRGYAVSRESDEQWRARTGLFCSDHPKGAWAA